MAIADADFAGKVRQMLNRILAIRNSCQPRNWKSGASGFDSRSVAPVWWRPFN